MNARRTIRIITVASFLFLVFPVFRASPAQGAGEKEQDRPFDARERDRTARLLASWRDAFGKSDPESIAALREVQAELEEILARIRGENSEPLSAVRSWSRMFRNDEFADYAGRIGYYKQRKCPFDVGYGQTCEVVHQVRVPSSYRANRPTPLVLCLHPTTEDDLDGVEFIRSFWSTRGLRHAAIVVAPEWPDLDSSDRTWSDRKALFASLGVLGRGVLPEYNVDLNRIFLDGYADSVGDVWRIAAAMADVFAGVIIRGEMPPAGIQLSNLTNTAVLLIAVPGRGLDPDAARALAERMRHAGVTVRVAELSEPPSSRRLRRAFQEVEEPVASFIDEVRRNPYPERIDWTIGDTHTRRSFFVHSTGELEAALFSGEAARRAPSYRMTVDRARNGLDFTTHRILGLGIELNDLILDLDKPVSIRVNGEEVYRAKPERKLQSVVESVLSSGDWTRIYPCRISVELPRRQRDEAADAVAADPR